MKYFVFIFGIILFSQCTGNQETAEEEDSLPAKEVKIDSTFFIGKPEKLFLEFWYGMSNDEFDRVADYLVENRIIKKINHVGGSYSLKYIFTVPSGEISAGLDPIFENENLRAIKLSIHLPTEMKEVPGGGYVNVDKTTYKLRELILILDNKYKEGRVYNLTLLPENEKHTYLLDWYEGNKYIKAFYYHSMGKGIPEYLGVPDDEPEILLNPQRLDDVSKINSGPLTPNWIHILYSNVGYIQMLHKQIVQTELDRRKIKETERNNALKNTRDAL